MSGRTTRSRILTSTTMSEASGSGPRTWIRTKWMPVVRMQRQRVQSRRRIRKSIFPTSTSMTLGMEKVHMVETMMTPWTMMTTDLTRRTSTTILAEMRTTIRRPTRPPTTTSIASTVVTTVTSTTRVKSKIRLRQPPRTVSGRL